MKILMLSPVFPPSLGGIEQHVLNLAKELASRGNTVHVLTTKIGFSGGKEKNPKGLKVFRVSAGLNSFKDLSEKGKNLVLPMGLKAVFLNKRFDYDLIHAHCPFSLMAAVPLKAFFKKPLIATIHGNWVNCIKGRRYFGGEICRDYAAQKCSKCLNQSKTMVKLKQAFLFNAAQSADQMIAVSSDVKKSIKLKKKIPVEVIPNVCSAPEKKASKARARKLIKARKKFVVSFVGALIKEKGAMELLQAVPEVTKKNSEAEFHFIFHSFKENYLQKIKAFVEEKKLQGLVFFHERVPNRAVRERFLRASDLVVLPSLWPEPCSSIATEAMNEGAIVVASRRGGFTDLIQSGKTGFLFNPSNPKELPKMLLLKLSGNRKLLSRVKKNALSRVRKELNWKKAANKTLKVYKGVLERND